MTKADKEWLAMIERVNAFKDKVGCSVDPGIRTTVAALNLLGFPTEMSCQGHLDHDYPVPWVCLALDYKETKYGAVVNYKKLKKLVGLLDWYCADLYTSLYDAPLFIDRTGFLSTTGFVRQYARPAKIKKDYLDSARDRFQGFARCIGEQYLSVSFELLTKTNATKEEIDACDKAYVQGIKRKRGGY